MFRVIKRNNEITVLDRDRKNAIYIFKNVKAILLLTL